MNLCMDLAVDASTGRVYVVGHRRDEREALRARRSRAGSCACSSRASIPRRPRAPTIVDLNPAPHLRDGERRPGAARAVGRRPARRRGRRRRRAASTSRAWARTTSSCSTSPARASARPTPVALGQGPRGPRARRTSRAALRLEPLRGHGLGRRTRPPGPRLTRVPFFDPTPAADPRRPRDALRHALAQRPRPARLRLVSRGRAHGPARLGPRRPVGRHEGVRPELPDRAGPALRGLPPHEGADDHADAAGHRRPRAVPLARRPRRPRGVRRARSSRSRAATRRRSTPRCRRSRRSSPRSRSRPTPSAAPTTRCRPRLPLPGHFTTGRFGPAGQPLPTGNAQRGLALYRTAQSRRRRSGRAVRHLPHAADRAWAPTCALLASHAAPARPQRRAPPRDRLASTAAPTSA